MVDGEESARARNGFSVVSICLAILLVATLGAQLPTPGWWQGYRATAQAVWPQGWGFFTEPPAPELVVYAQDTRGWRSLMLTPQGRADNLFGLSRRQRTQAPEISAVADSLPADGWRACSATSLDGCSGVVRAAPRLKAVDHAVQPTLCGSVVLVLEHLDGDDWRITGLAVVEVTCSR